MESQHFECLSKIINYPCVQLYIPMADVRIKVLKGTLNSEVNPDLTNVDVNSLNVKDIKLKTSQTKNPHCSVFRSPRVGGWLPTFFNLL